MTDWADLSLPCPRRAEYGWRIDAGLNRTPFAGPLPEQAAARSSRRQTFGLTWFLTGEQLARAETYLLDSAYAGEGIVLDLLTSAGFGPVTVRLCADLEVQPTDGDLYRLRAQFETLVAVAPATPLTCDDLSDNPNELCPPDDSSSSSSELDPTVWVYKLNLYVLVQGIATGASVNKANLYSVFNVLGDAVNALKVNLYGVHHGIATGAAASKVNVYGVMGGIATGAAARKVNLYVVIDTIEDSSS